MAELKSQSCEACKIDAPRLTDAEITNLISEINDWDLIQEPVKQIKKIFSFPDYQSGVNFLNAVATMADQEDHHPEITFSYNAAKVTYFTYACLLYTSPSPRDS